MFHNRCLSRLEPVARILMLPNLECHGVMVWCVCVVVRCLVNPGVRYETPAWKGLPSLLQAHSPCGRRRACSLMSLSTRGWMLCCRHALCVVTGTPSLCVHLFPISNRLTGAKPPSRVMVHWYGVTVLVSYVRGPESFIESARKPSPSLQLSLSSLKSEGPPGTV